MDIRGHYSAEGHCYLQYSQLYLAAFEITEWIDNMFPTIRLLTYDVDEQISAEDEQYGST